MPINLAHTELQQKKHALELEINKLSSQAEIKGSKVKELSDSVTDLNGRIETLTVTVTDIQKFGNDAVDLLTSTISSCIETIKSTDECVDKAERIVKNLGVEIDAQLIRLETIKKEQTDRQEQIALDNAKLDVRKQDLTIYTNRLQAKYDQLGLGKLIL